MDDDRTIHDFKLASKFGAGNHHCNGSYIVYP